MKSQSALVRSDSTIELDSISFIYLDFSFIIHPRNSEHDCPFRFDYPFEDILFLILRILFYKLFDGINNFFYGLDEFRFVRILFLYELYKGFRVKHDDLKIKKLKD